MSILKNYTGNRSRWNRLADGTTYLAAFGLLTALYYLSCQLSTGLGMLPGTVSPLWPPAALGVFAVLKRGPWIAPAIFLGALLSLLTTRLPWYSAALIGMGSVLEACTAAWLVRRFYQAEAGLILRGPVFRFVGIALVCAMLGAAFGTAALALAYGRTPSMPGVQWVTWWLGDATGMIVGVPLLLAWNPFAGVRWAQARITEALAFSISLLVTAQIAFGGTLGTLPIAYLPIPFLLWAAFRFNFSAVNWTTAVICSIAVWNTARDTGPFSYGDGSFHTSLTLLMVYVGVLGTTGLALASLIYRNQFAQRELRSERDKLEQRVAERTKALVKDIEARKRIERALAARERELADAQHLAQVGSWNWEIQTSTITWSDELYRILGVDNTLYQANPESFRQFVHKDDLPALTIAMDQCREPGQSFFLEHRVVLPNGEIRTVAAHIRSILAPDGKLLRLLGTAQDITDAKAAEQSLREAEERYRTVVELSPDAILAQQDGTLVLANRAAITLVGATRIDDIVGHSLFRFIEPQFHELVRERTRLLEQGDVLPALENTVVRLDGTKVDVEICSSAFMHLGKFASMYVIRDITDRKRTQEQMAYLAHYDSLTGLPNRVLFYQRLEHALTIAERPGRSLEVLFLDLDRFKMINDTLGHAVGDLVLREAAQRLQGTLRESDTVARLGGDEFVVLVENIDEPHRGGIIAEKVLAAFRRPFDGGREPLRISTSIGISSFPTDGSNADTLIKHADKAMYRAKEVGRNSYRYYSPAMNRDAQERLALESALSGAIENHQLSIHYQPKVDILSNRISGMEALLRWRHPTLGDVPPQRFIPLAEDTGLIHSIGYWAMRTACAQNRAWQVSGSARLKVAVNLSVRQLVDDRLIDNISAILEETGLEACYLELEITETAVMAEPDKAVQVLKNLQQLGVSVAIDDFGAGYSSLSYLKQFPIRAVKIDQSFVQALPSSHSDSAITKAIISLAHSMECSVIAEGTETRQQFEFLREHACDSVQGFYFSEPMPADKFGKLLRSEENLRLH
ncbi:EAL domain-containing protein [Noviherbaspirillum saxi]|nr:EAL domain-containing protein [Noviherbaspirillum saxi]